MSYFTARCRWSNQNYAISQTYQEFALNYVLTWEQLCMVEAERLRRHYRCEVCHKGIYTTCVRSTQVRR